MVIGNVSCLKDHMKTGGMVMKDILSSSFVKLGRSKTQHCVVGYTYRDYKRMMVCYSQHSLRQTDGWYKDLLQKNW